MPDWSAGLAFGASVDEDKNGGIDCRLLVVMRFNFISWWRVKKKGG
jgi:hypothetical protein